VHFNEYQLTFDFHSHDHRYSCLWRAFAAMARGRVATALLIFAALHSALAAVKDVTMTTLIITTPGCAGRPWLDSDTYTAS
jgi:hypothetical protein